MADLEAKQSVIHVVEAGAERDLSRWLDTHAGGVNAQLSEHCAVLLRGFDTLRADEFEVAMSKVIDGICIDNGEHNRESLSGGVSTPVFYPSTEKILWHNENSFNLRWPKKICFRCDVPAEQGGETPLVDTRRLLQRLDPTIRKRFASKQIKYVRTYQRGMGLSWQKTFQVQTKAEAEQYCHANDIGFTWDGAILKTSSVRKAIISHPVSRGDCWFAQPTHWHPYFLPAKTRQMVLDFYGPAGLPRNCQYGDGSEIETGVLDELLGLLVELEVSFPWRHDDVLLVDNVSAAHARNPFSGERKLMVCMGEMGSFERTAAPNEA